jgi:hypothetical protein
MFGGFCFVAYSSGVGKGVRFRVLAKMCLYLLLLLLHTWRVLARVVCGREEEVYLSSAYYFRCIFDGYLKGCCPGCPGY